MNQTRKTFLAYRSFFQYESADRGAYLSYHSQSAFFFAMKAPTGEAYLSYHSQSAFFCAMKALTGGLSRLSLTKCILFRRESTDRGLISLITHKVHSFPP
jgi:hypothetical protein